MPKFSVIIPLYNKELNISNTLESVFNQTFRDFEVLIIDDGSTDRSLEIVKSLKDSRVKIIEKENEGVATTRNKGIVIAQAPYIAFLDADDIWYPNHLEVINELIVDFPNNSWFATSYYKQFSNNVLIKMSSSLFKTNFKRGLVKDFFVYSTVDSLAWTSAVVMQKTFIENLGFFDVAITHGAGEDTDLWIRAALKSSLVFTTEFTAVHIMHADNRISNTKTQLRNFINLDLYDTDSRVIPGLKKYLDINRFSIALQHKIAGDLKTFQSYFDKIELENLNYKQRLLLRLPGTVLKQLLNLKRTFQTNGVYLTAFK